METAPQLNAIKRKLLAYADSIATETLFPTIVPEAAPLIAKDPYAFSIAICLDRGMKAEVAWTIPYYVKEQLGHLDPRRIYKMSLEDLAAMFACLPHKPRYIHDAPKTIRDLTRIVVEECNGDACRIWRDKHAADVTRTFTSIHGVGPGIANMGVLLIERAFRLRFDDMDRPNMDIKPDTHTVRVLYRLGASNDRSDAAAIHAARHLSPEFPGAVDPALWDIGRRFCRPSTPKCVECPMDGICVRHFL